MENIQESVINELNKFFLNWLQLCPQQCVNSYFRPQQAMLWTKIVIYTLLWMKIKIKIYLINLQYTEPWQVCPPD